ncbi:hypothetical protein [Staphylococcus aureus]|uniref:hypothetical protein n=1 Tax=Staphylococcus aureus TaxID=1280 RepID=UPI00210AAFE7|nr:hypothetical protein [Staphylococcus aureus]
MKSKEQSNDINETKKTPTIKYTVKTKVNEINLMDIPVVTDEMDTELLAEIITVDDYKVCFHKFMV